MTIYLFYIMYRISCFHLIYPMLLYNNAYMYHNSILCRETYMIYYNSISNETTWHHVITDNEHNDPTEVRIYTIPEIWFLSLEYVEYNRKKKSVKFLETFFIVFWSIKKKSVLTRILRLPLLFIFYWTIREIHVHQKENLHYQAKASYNIIHTIMSDRSFLHHFYNNLSI